MKRILDLMVLCILSLLLISGYSLGKSKKQAKKNENMSKQTTMQNDPDYAKSMGYYRYAEKNIITDKSKDESYKGKFYGQNDMGKSSSNMAKPNMKMLPSHKKMMSSNNMMNNSKQKMGKEKTKWSSAKSKVNKDLKKKTN